ncbi:DUF5666 domain-containing protein [Deferrisoma camini]|uniref:DUF5666 domain-containing protein n=1 Tax=Deferrisoma camini TaxID=1035120 RepID=UPI00046CEE03|nr:DUF5666 domain-containing protein [Deferrisoma camini]
MRIVTWSALIGAALAVAGCGGAGGTAALDSGPGGGIGGTGSVAVTAQGPIQGFGSVIVNGVEFELPDGATVLVDGVPAAEQDLSEGMVVRITGTYRPGETTTAGYVPGEADEVRYDSTIRGVVTWVSGSAFEVLGRAVRVVGSTRFGDDERPELGDFVEVSGLDEPDGGLRATFVRVIKRSGEFDPETDEVKVKGAAHTVDPEAGTFRVGDQPVRAPAGVPLPAENEVVEVRGHLQNGVLVAEAIEGGESPLPEGHEVEISGVVNLASGTWFTLDGTEVDAADAKFEGGTAADLRPGLRVEVEGTVESGIVIAREVEIQGGEDD